MVMHRQWGGSPCEDKRVFLTSLEASGAGGQQTLSVPASQRAGLGGSDLFCRRSSALRCSVNADRQEWMDARLPSREQPVGRMGPGLQCLDPGPEHPQQGRLSSWSRMLRVLVLGPETRHITVGKRAASTPEHAGRKQVAG